MTDSAEDIPPPAKPMRLQRFLAQCGLGSRRDCEELISSGRVSVDGVTVSTLGATVEPGRQKVSLDGERLKVERKKYFLLNKPSGYLCTADDPEGRRTVLDLFPAEGPRLFTVGRLDENTTGLLVVTNDGDLAQKLAHPKYRIFRLYRAQVAGLPDRAIFEQLKQGLFFTEGKFRVHDIVPVKKQKDSTWVEITMTEGQNREIRRLFARVGYKIMKLQRIGFGPLRLGRLGVGEYRDLSRDELAELHGILQRNQESAANLTVTDRRPAGERPPSPRGPGKAGAARGGRDPSEPRTPRSRQGGSPRTGQPASGHQRPGAGERPTGAKRRPAAGERFAKGDRRPPAGERPARGDRRPPAGERPARGDRTAGERRPARGERPPAAEERRPAADRRSSGDRGRATERERTSDGEHKGKPKGAGKKPAFGKPAFGKAAASGARRRPARPKAPRRGQGRTRHG